MSQEKEQLQSQSKNKHNALSSRTQAITALEKRLEQLERLLRNHLERLRR